MRDECQKKTFGSGLSAGALVPAYLFEPTQMEQSCKIISAGAAFHHEFAAGVAQATLFSSPALRYRALYWLGRIHRRAVTSHEPLFVRSAYMRRFQIADGSHRFPDRPIVGSAPRPVAPPSPIGSYTTAQTSKVEPFGQRRSSRLLIVKQEICCA
jgi:hypothetical protein